MDRRPFEQFAHQRARLQRLRDAKLFSGWLYSGSRQGPEIVVQDAAPIQVNDLFFCRLLGADYDAYFAADATELDSAPPSESQAVSLAEMAAAPRTKLCKMRVLGKIEFRPSLEEVRRLAQGVMLRLRTSGGRLETAVVDVSPSGIGILAARSFARGEEVELDLDLPTGSIRCSASVMYCRRLPGAPGHFRVGLTLGALDRLSRNHWNRLFSQVA